MQSFKRYLDERGIDDNSPDEVKEEARREYRRMYRRRYQADLRARTRRVELVLKKPDAKELESAAKEHGMPLATFIRHASLAYARQTYIVPDPETVRELEIGLRRIGTNVNQIAKHANTERQVTTLDLERVWDLLEELESVVSEAFRNPSRQT